MNFNTGNFFLEATDYQQADIGFSLEIVRTYNTQSTVSDGPFGEKWSFPYAQHLELYANGSVGYRNAAGALTVFSLDEKGNFVRNDEEHLRLIADRAQKEFTVQEKDGTKTVFDLNSGWLLRMEDCNGNAIQLLRQKNGYLSAVRLPSGTVASIEIMILFYQW